MSEARKTPQSHFTGPVVIDPLTRIEGHLRIEVEVKDGRVSEARSVGTLYRGLETILVGRDPRDVQHFTQRTCGVCTYTHALASTRALEDAIKVEIPKNATYIRNLVLGMQYLHDHIVHFYHLHALDFVDVTSALQADPVKAAKICSSVSPRPAAGSPTGWSSRTRRSPTSSLWCLPRGTSARAARRASRARWKRRS